MTWSSGWAHERGQGCATESQSRATIENGESPTSSGIALESPIGRESRSHLVVVALSRHEIAWLRPEKVQEGETLRRACGEARRKRNESCSRNRRPGSRRSYQREMLPTLTTSARMPKVALAFARAKARLVRNPLPSPRRAKGARRRGRGREPKLWLRKHRRLYDLRGVRR